MYQKEIIYMGLYRDGSRMGSAGFLKVENREQESRLFLKIQNIPLAINGRFPIRIYDGSGWKELHGITIQDGGGSWEEVLQGTVSQTIIQIVLSGGYVLEGRSKYASNMAIQGDTELHRNRGTGIRRDGSNLYDAKVPESEEKEESIKEPVSVIGQRITEPSENPEESQNTIKMISIETQQNTEEPRNVGDQHDADKVIDTGGQQNIGRPENIDRQYNIEKEDNIDRRWNTKERGVEERQNAERIGNIEGQHSVERPESMERQHSVEEPEDMEGRNSAEKPGNIEEQQNMAERRNTGTQENVRMPGRTEGRQNTGKEKGIELWPDIGNARTRNTPAMQRDADAPHNVRKEPQTIIITEELPRRTPGNTVIIPQDAPEYSLKEDKWEQILDTYERIHPYGDKRVYVKLEPKDFVILQSKYQHLVNNSFLLHGFYNYRYIILGKEDEYYLGVPGVFYEREKMVALMFGFEAFECPGGNVKAGEFGYYLRKVEL